MGAHAARPGAAGHGAQPLHSRRVYHGQGHPARGIVPAEQILRNAQFRPEMVGVHVPLDIYSHISGIDIVRAPDASARAVLRAGRQPARAQRRELHARRPQDDDAAVPRTVRAQVAGGALPRPAAGHPARQRPAGAADPTVVVLTPGMYNSAYFEHAFLAQQMGVELVEGRTCGQGPVRVHAHHARPQRVDVIYRRVDDDFLDPTVSAPTSTWAVRG